MTATTILATSEQTGQTQSRTLLYFRFRSEVGGAIQQLEYDLLQTYLSQHRGYDDSAADRCRDGNWAVVATSESGVGTDASEYTSAYLRSIPVIEISSISTTPPTPNQPIV